MSKVFGANIRPGQRPGGMKATTYDALPRVRRSNKRGIVHAAAKAFLDKRGFFNHINAFEATAFQFPKSP